MLSKNLSLFEATRSATASELGIDNTPNAEQLANLTAAANRLFQPVRDALGVPLIITSGLRVPALNKAVNGSPNSYHMMGAAFDVKMGATGRAKGLTNKDIFDAIYLSRLVFCELIWEYGDEEEPDWVHMAYLEGRNGRTNTKRAYRVGKKTRFHKPFDLY